MPEIASDVDLESKHCHDSYSLKEKFVLRVPNWDVILLSMFGVFLKKKKQAHFALTRANTVIESVLVRLFSEWN